ncbi:MAG: 1-acyl-sn-glycerol-3-phosphate acyltransferase [Planctomycetes bacterium]|nr:1-acyl-sn-glycerol-3-phosphate acyltransferase [Planctomycetota bacterium]MCB9888477.1 1-acyl-sn-glycerol-3-phosphate acyltransferase [Planctomycetota bacterium]
MRTFLRSYGGLVVTNPPQLSGGYVVVANHTSFLDPIVLGAVNPRRVAFLMNAVAYRNPLGRWFYRMFRSIPVELSGVGREAIRAAHEALDGDEVVGVFPEGGISRHGGLLLGSPGAVALVLSKSVPVVPVGLVGVDRVLPYGKCFPRPRRIEVRYGDPIAASELMIGEGRKERLAHATLRIMREIAALTGQTAREDWLASVRG